MSRIARSLVVLLLLISFVLPSSTALAQGENPETPPISQGTDSPNSVYLPFVASMPPDQAMTLEDASFTLDDFATVEELPKPAGGESAPVDAEAFVPPEPPKAEANPELEAAALNEIDSVDAWTTILSEGFEYVWPGSGWASWDDNGYSYGDLTWDDESYNPYSGGWSAWPAGGGANARSPYNSNYADNMRTFMRYGPFSLVGATAATFSFNLWNQSELNYDYVGWWVSTNGYNFYGQRTSGSTGGWTTRSVNLASVPGLGSVLGRSQVWIAFTFTSDSSVTYKGPFIDNVTLRKDTNPCPNSMYAQYYSGTSFNSRYGTACENYFIYHDWGTGGPGFGIGSNNFSARYTGSVPFAGGWYTFRLTSDDGSRLWVDNSLLINGWQLQAITSRYATVYLAPGRHNVRVDYFEADGGAYLDLTWWR